MFKFNKLKIKKRHEFFSHVSEDILKLFERGNKITLEEYKNLVANSYERKLIFPRLNNDALIYKLKYCMNQCVDIGTYEIPISYDHFLASDGIAELLVRFENLNDKLDCINDLKDTLQEISMMEDCRVDEAQVMASMCLDRNRSL